MARRLYSSYREKKHWDESQFVTDPEKMQHLKRFSDSGICSPENEQGGINGFEDRASPLKKSKRQRIWSSFKKLRPGYKDKDKTKPKKLGKQFSQSQPNVSDHDLKRHLHSNSRTDLGKPALESTVPVRTAESIDPSEIYTGNNLSRDKPAGGADAMIKGRFASDTALNNLNADINVKEMEEQDSGITIVDSQQWYARVAKFLDGLEHQKHITALRSHPFYQLNVILYEGRDLVIRDSSGTSDPYVKFKVAGKQLYRSRTKYKNLNPRWDEKFSIPIEDVFKPVVVKVFDYDRGLSDDQMGSGEIDLKQLDLNVPVDMTLKLSSPGQEEYMGYLKMQLTLVPKTQEEKEQDSSSDSDTDNVLSHFFHKGQQQQSSYGETAKKLKSQIWNSVVTIVLIEGKQLLPMDDNGLSDPYVKFRLGNEKCRSKVKSKTLEPRWLEEFQLHMFDDYSKQLEITVWDKDVTGDDFMGRAVIDLNTLESERTHKVVQPLEDGAGVITLLITVTGSAGRETISDLSNYTPIPYERDAIVQKYGLIKSFRNMPDIGWLQVKVIKAEGLASADFGGKSDPYCVLELVNDYLQTQTEYKTLNPEWNKVFTFNVKDIHSVLEVTVYDEDRDMKKEFLGKVAIPLLKICKGERKIFALKDRKLQKRTKGTIHLELDIVYNHFKAAIRTVNPREEKYMQPEPKMKISLLKRNVARMASIVTAVRDTAQFVQSCFTWESKMRSALAFLSFLVIVWNFELYMLPLTLLLILLWNYFMHQVAISLNKDTEYTQTTTAVVEEEDEDEEKDKEENRSLREKLDVIQGYCLTVQNILDHLASLGERVKNTFNWSVPWLTTFAVIVLFIATIILYYIPLRLIILAWGINKFTKKLRKPNAIPNNELLDFLSRVPNDIELMEFREFPLENSESPQHTSGRKKRE